MLEAVHTYEQTLLEANLPLASAYLACLRYVGCLALAL